MKYIIPIFFLISACLGALEYNPPFDEKTNNANWITTYPKLRATKFNETINKPLFHFAPSSGWMNDPNGCFKNPKTGEWNLYFQYCGLRTVWCAPMFWGHAISYDMNTWEEKDLAIGPPDTKSGVFSGSIFIDEDNDSEFFPEDTEYPNVIAAWTYNYDKSDGHHQDQWISYSKDGGLTFITIPEGTTVNGERINPNVESLKNNENSPDLSVEFRDPQVIKYIEKLDNGNTNKYFIMTVAKTQEYRINFYSSTNGRKFKKEGNFQFGGYLGHQYECPNLVHLKNPEYEEFKDEQSYWILFISINPGSLMGGSSTQYLIGQFGRIENYQDNNLTFTLSYPYPVQLDMGKDFYALQLFYEVFTEEQLLEGLDEIRGIAWTSNWQYGNYVPTDTWRSSMSIPRKFSLAHHNLNYDTKVLYLNQEPVLEHDFFKNLEGVEPIVLDGLSQNIIQNIYDAEGKAYGALEFFLEFKLDPWGDPSFIALYLRGGSNPDEYLTIGYSADYVFFDRGHTNVQWVKEHPFFTEKFSMLAQRIGGHDEFTIYGIIDRNICELFVNVRSINERKAFMTMTNTFFFTGGNFINSIDFIQKNGSKVKEATLRVRQIFPEDLTYTTKPSNPTTGD